MKRFLIAMFCLVPLCVFAAYLSNIPSEVMQPDGTVLQLFASGDEYANHLHDAEGYSVIQSPQDGYYYYAVQIAGEPAPSAHRYGSIDPKNLGVEKHIDISKAARDAKIAFLQAPVKKGGKAPNTGTVNNLNVFIRFSDQTEFSLSREFYDARFNETGDDAYSLQNYFNKVSYNQLNYVTHHYPECLPQENLSYQDNHPRSYYMPYNAITNPGGYVDSNDRTFREQNMLANAIASIASQVPSSLNIDADNDGYVDNVCFIIRGPHTAWADLLWAHRWVLYYADAMINNKQVWDFTFQPEDQNNVRTLCHEMFHSVGAPDLYHYTYNGITPTGCWDIMESGNGHMSQYMKYKYGGWINSIPTATIGGTYTLNPSTSATNNVYKVAIPGSNSQYLVLEYRKRGSDVFEAELPGSGLLIYRIHQNYQGNAEGPPDEVYIFRPNGTSTVNGLIADAPFSADNWQTEFNAYTNPAAFLTNGNPFQVNIHNISAAGETISFQLSATTAALAPVISAISPVSGSILANADFTVSVNATAPNNEIERVDFSLNGSLLASDEATPYSAVVNASELNPGLHTLSIVAYSYSGLYTTKNVSYRIVNPAQENWFSWLSDNPTWTVYGRGAVPIKVAVDMDLGDQEYLVKAIRFGMEPDPWGAPQLPGLVNAKINRFAGGAITEQTLLDIGSLYNLDYDANATFILADSTRISGQIAVILDLFEYQNIMFDLNAPCGHSWLTEPNRIWTDALGRGVQGAAKIELLLQSPYVDMDDEAVPVAGLQLGNHPNPFAGNTVISYSLKEPAPVEVNIYNLKGQKVKTLLNPLAGSGKYELVWDGKDSQGNKTASGIYLYRLKAGNRMQTAKMLRLD